MQHGSRWFKESETVRFESILTRIAAFHAVLNESVGSESRHDRLIITRTSGHRTSIYLRVRLSVGLECVQMRPSVLGTVEDTGLQMLQCEAVLGPDDEDRRP